ncbi:MULTISPECIES: mechanosensitive ion channel family protein [Cytobacillus]|jgi:small conductance mechanosensitive channel|uniref:Mechanosensitive ion channel protein n=2 Tax=Cytobacillus oceanisediminis TaxID=665099 RepID=A0A160M9V3_9BACI|nr:MULTISPECIES: mechanosensitive ion channel family protein [Cytobacillus]MBY0157596.1 mechanosensitive ion channel family protein [Cytobacillus firmus]AND39203.1 mechanosensitive ion channel protein [Cytobacillus oceanisediminis 2691]MBU8733142.1 mechanosensitive ion channel family protein [Cytobacillus oceanisediminis]MCM3241669.1 mechanosensitive ion channel family protein [Cytobacillus oceanisediminis]MCM3395671.1 mechanosensitive ion channel family protein [Cytobacillus oceanisediminis]
MENLNLSQINWEALLIDAGLILLKLAAIYFAFLIVKSAGNKIIHKSFEGIGRKERISPGRSKTLQSLAKNIFSYVLIFIFAVTILQIFGIKATAILAGAGVVGLAVGFGAQGLVSDVVTGFFILLERQIDVGDYVTTGSYSGIVEQIGLKTTQIRGFDGTLHYIPNREITSLSNHSRGNMRALVDIGISYDDNIDEAITVLQETCDKIAEVNQAIVEGPNVIGVQTLGSSDVVLRIIAKTENMEQWAVERQLRKALKEALEANGIEIPFPHQVLIQKHAGSESAAG